MANFRLIILFSWQLMINKQKTMFFSKNIIAGYFYIVFISFNSIGLGYLVAYMLKFYDEFQQFRLLSYYFFFIIIIVVLIKVFSTNRIFQNINIKKFIYYPINLKTMLIVDYFLSFIDVSNLFLLLFILGLIIGISDLAIGIVAILFLLFLALTIIILIHLLAEIVQTIQKLISSFNKKIYISILLLILFLITMFLLVNSPLEVIMNSPIGWVLNLIIMSIADKIEVNMCVNLINIYIIIILGTLLTIRLKLLSIKHQLKGASKNHILISMKINNYKIVKSFPHNLQVYLIKDFSYLLRSNRFLLALAGEFVILGFVYLNYLLNSAIYNNIFFAILISCLFPLILWDFYISNIWGFEKGGFVNYLYMPVDFKKLIISKNLAFFVIVIPLILFVSFFLGIIFGVKYFVFLVFLQLLSLFPLVIVSNINSIKNPFPVDLKESVFSSNGKFKLSILSSISLSITYIILSFIVMSLIKSGLNITLTIITIVLSIVSFLFYLLSFNYVVKLFYNEKENIFKELLND